MEIQQFIFNFLATILALAAFYLFKSYWPKYFEAKGTNQATKEDIGEITNIVETIKSDLLQQNEFLKAQLSFNNQHKLNLKTAEREAIFEFNKRVSAWLYSLLRVTFSNYSVDNFREIKLLPAEFAKRQYECDLAEAHLVLFMNDKEFLELKRDLTIGIIRLERIIGKSIHNIHYAYSKLELNLDFDKGDTKKQMEIRDLFYKELSKLTETHRTDSLEAFKHVQSFQTRMTALINKRLKQLEDEEKNIS